MMPDQAPADRSDIEIVVHIGAHKTGSTSLQEFCAENVSMLAALGIYYPANLFAAYPEQHSHLTSMLESEDDPSIGSLIDRLVQKASELGARTVFLSGEELCCCKPELIQRLASFCDTRFAKRKFVFVARDRRGDALSNYKHYLRFAPILTDAEIIESVTDIRASPKEVIGNWLRCFSPNGQFLTYHELRGDLIRKFFSSVFGVHVSSDLRRNASHDLLTGWISNIFLKEWLSPEVEAILYELSLRFHGNELSFAIENSIADALEKKMPDDAWCVEPYQGTRSLIHGVRAREPGHDPVAVCEKMIWLFGRLQKHFEAVGMSGRGAQAGPMKEPSVESEKENVNPEPDLDPPPIPGGDP